MDAVDDKMRRPWIRLPVLSDVTFELTARMHLPRKNGPFREANVTRLETLNANFVGSCDRAVELVERFNERARLP